jgi:16S rRNA (cytidine1402-2'-O)-methyltransferase
MSKLYLVPTPIGNLEDVTMRALRVLKEADIIIAEDKRKSGILLKHYDIKSKLISYHKFNEHSATTGIAEMIKTLNSAALISDAGTPGISDPGYLLVKHCIENDIVVECLPGPGAVIPAIAASGLPSDRFVFEGFLPRKKGRQTRLKELVTETRTMIFFESPHRLVKTLYEFAEYFGNERKASVAREISKIYEENIRGTISEIIEHYNKNVVKGEIVIVVAGVK